MSKSKLNTIHDVIANMQALDQELKGSKLDNLRAFNTTYLIITKAVAKRFGSSYFNSDALMEQFDITFAHYYFTAYENYTNGQLVAPAWQILFDACKKDNLLQAQYMALGVNAHVNNDLAFSLHDMVDNNQDDFLKINHVIYLSIPEVIDNLKEKNKYIENIKNITKPAYPILLQKLIARWRQSAWNNYKKLAYKETTEEKISRKAEAIAHYLMLR